MALLAFLLAVSTDPAVAGPARLSITSPAFAPGQPIPPKYARAHENLSPPLHISGVEEGVQSLALVVEDPDAPDGLFTHWILWNISPKDFDLAEGQVPAGALQGKNSAGDTHYDGPFPPSGTHHYIFHVYALVVPAKLGPGADRAAFNEAIKGKVLTSAQLIGTYQAER